ncbi:HAMP domain-containing histidine kinase [candidate division KSB1 bacterium]|nr:HAMP domain-containing histidine kinase [candidate division KSB1 bacterium]
MNRIRKSPITRILLIIVFIIVIPTLSYTFIQISRLNKNEALIRDIYERQLSAILFSINQYCWDVVNSWTNTLKADFAETLPPVSATPPRHQLPTVSLTLQYYYGTPPELVIQKLNPEKPQLTATQIKALFQTHPAELERLFTQAAKGYERIQPLMPASNAVDFPGTLLVFVLNPEATAEKPGWLGGMLVDTEAFGREILSRKMNELQSEDFIFGVTNRRTGHVLFTSQSISTPSFEREKALWLFPDLQLGLRMRGQTLQEMARARVRSNLWMLIGMDVILLAGVLILFRIVASEMALAKLKSDFVANVSHELRTPLALIRMFAETLELGRVPSEEKKLQYYHIISNESTRLTRLINNLLDFSRIEAGKKIYHLKWTDLHQVVEDVLQSYSFHLQQQGFKLQTNLATDLPQVRIDAEAIAQAFINLLENAMKYSQDTKSISITLALRNNQIVLSVSDQGIGIDKNQQLKIFDKFYRVGDSLVHDTKGFGLGLTLVKYIMDYHRGRIELESTPGKGSTFSLIFPLSSNQGEFSQ